MRASVGEAVQVVYGDDVAAGIIVAANGDPSASVNLQAFFDVEYPAQFLQDVPHEAFRQDPSEVCWRRPEQGA